MESLDEMPSRAGDIKAWWRWAWLAGRKESADAETLLTLRRLILDPTYDGRIRTAALASYWMFVPVLEALDVEQMLWQHDQVMLALVGLEHPRFWHDGAWFAKVYEWTGRHESMDEAIRRVVDWNGYPTEVVRIPNELWSRLEFKQDPPEWDHVWSLGSLHLVDENLSPFEVFWRQHISDWVRKWLEWEETVYLYRWRLAEETALTTWTGTIPFDTKAPYPPQVAQVVLPQKFPAYNSLFQMMLGLGYYWEQQQNTSQSAKWDAMWASWSSSLHYQRYEMASNIQVTEWHIGGLSGDIRDGAIDTHWNLSLD